ncbi:uncharacterized protein LOC112089699 [Eutrema salsugineum]|uniref:uncharacterized protein LOC112089699 n=1 Tax=Eutrema salsugineum TaxID=72664 RepID=UPI000CED69E2|nr:uncharacterized protein LOC112089699 [Eutrema salsugineum]
MDLELRVSDLISEHGEWMENKVHELFPPNDAVKILDMPIGRVPDRHIWAYTDDGAYSVKSGYWLLANHPHLAQPPVSLLCSQSSESINHVLFQCESARAIWDLSRLNLPSNGFSNSLENKNAFLFSGNQDSSARIIQVANDEAKAWKEANNLVDTEDACKWQPSPNGKLKCNLNVHWRNSRLHCGAAWIVRDHMSYAIFHARDAFTKAPNRTIAELKGVIWAIKSLRDLRLENVVLALDCRKAFTAIMNLAKIPCAHRSNLQVAAGLGHCRF